MLLALALIATSCARSHPTDEAMIRNFREHRGDFDRLITMFKADRGLGRVGRTFTRPDDPSRVAVTLERIAEYRRLCKAVGTSDCIEGYDRAFDELYGGSAKRDENKDPIWLHASSHGLSISGSSKGYYYSATVPNNVVASLDGLKSHSSKTWFRHIDGPWYLYFDYED